ncbi:keratin, type I cytoskeletal 50 kDa-like [Morone saxatilis]|uniref:keratin, type I cytoskeletal 50 kDa-like n=1 Tax=Morone saxatilis TaxID=34816 RepID=UPI0015E1D5FE|nr:keratin, type I cytoskeletal 50 kDa-like [Morone saxatilis]
MQVLHASRAAQAALGYRLQHGPGGLVHYSTAPAVAAVSPDSSTGFCLSREKVTLQQLNKRLAAYLQQVQCLEAANQKLETQIQMELDRKCPSELRKLDGHLRTVSLLQEQISDCLSAQAQIKLQLLSAELTVFDLNVRCEKEREHCGCLEVDLSNLRVLEEELQVHKLPELHSLLNDQTQQLMGLHVQHQQDMQGLMAQMSGGVSVEMHPVASSDLIQQLDYLRQTSLLDENQNDCWFDTQVSTLSSPEVTFEPPAGSEVVQAELDGLRGRAASLEEELNKLQAQNMVLEASGLEQNEYFVQQLVVLQQRADSLCGDLDSVLQAAAQQAADYESLLDIKIRLEAEIQDYMRLLDGLSPQGYEIMIITQAFPGK